MASVVASVRDDSIIGRKRGRFLRLWPLSLTAGAVSCAVCRRRYSEGRGALQREEFSTSDNRSAAFVVYGGRRQLAHHRDERPRPRGLQQLGQRLFQRGQSPPGYRDGGDGYPVAAQFWHRPSSSWEPLRGERSTRFGPAPFRKNHSSLSQLRRSAQ